MPAKIYRLLLKLRAGGKYALIYEAEQWKCCSVQPNMERRILRHEAVMKFVKYLK